MTAPSLSSLHLFRRPKFWLGLCLVLSGSLLALWADQQTPERSPFGGDDSPPGPWITPAEEGNSSDRESGSGESDRDPGSADRTTVETPVSERPTARSTTTSVLLRGTDRPEFDGTRSVKVYVLPVQDGITRPVQFVLRRGLREAVVNGADVVLLDMNTPGGGLGVTLEMMEMLARFEGRTMTFVNPDAVSAGAFISCATEEIFFSPRGVMGAAAPIMGGGEDIPETALAKIMSYLRARVAAYGDGIPYRTDVLRAMFDREFVLEIDGEIIKPYGELLSLTASEAVREFGDPSHPLLALGIYNTIDDLLTDLYGEGNFEVVYFNVSWSEKLAQYLSLIAPLLIGGGILMLYLEAQSPGFGVFGIIGIILFVIFFSTNFVTGLAGHEALILFFIGILLILVEMFLLPGTVVFIVAGFFFVLGSLIWSLIDYWPQDGVAFEPTLLIMPIFNVIAGMILAAVAALVLVRFLPRSLVLDRLVLNAAITGHSQEGHPAAETEEGKTAASSFWPEPGARGIATSGLFPSGEVEINGRRYEATVEIGSINKGDEIEVTGRATFALIVKKL